MKYKVEALDTYERRGIEDAVIGKILKTGYQFEVNKERLDVLLGDNSFKEAFVKLVEEETLPEQEPTEETPTIKPSKKKGK